MAINKPFITPKNEKARLKALYEYDILNTVTEEEYDRIAKIAAEIFDVPVTFISLLDENNQWNKASHGFDMQIIPREIAFCNHTILNPDDVLVVPDLRKDERFANNPLVANAPNVVFYAGAPLTTAKGHVLGSLCLLDAKEKVLTQTQIEALKALSREIMAKLELRKKIKDLETAKRQLKKANVQLKGFARLVSHDIKTPVVSISMLAGILSNKFKNTDTASHESVSLIKESTRELLSFIDEMLQQAEDGGLHKKIARSSCSRSILESVVKLTATDANVTIELEGEFPTIGIDKSSMQQIFQNIIANAVKYTDKEITKIKISSKSDDSYHYFSISDNGMGIPKSQLNNLFKFGTTMSKIDKYGNKGTGYGLARVKDIIEGHNGHITVSSKLKSGTTFTVALQRS